MATVRCEVIISKSGKEVEKFPSTSKTYANRIGKSRAKEVGGTFEVKKIQPQEYNPANW